MARKSGITKIISKNNKILSIRKKGTPWSGWVGDYRIDIKENGNMSTIWKYLNNQIETPTSIINKLSEEGYCQLHTIKSFVINENYIKLTELFPLISSDTYCLFIRKKQDKGDVWRLATVGCKTAKEVLIAGYDYENNSYLPLIITVKILSDLRKEFIFLNSL